jgi:hypothetical protein
MTDLALGSANLDNWLVSESPSRTDWNCRRLTGWKSYTYVAT